MDTLTPLEQAVLEKILSGESEGYRILQKQIPTLRVTERKMTGVDFLRVFRYQMKPRNFLMKHRSKLVTLGRI
jgi:hypothetical protein